MTMRAAGTTRAPRGAVLLLVLWLLVALTLVTSTLAFSRRVESVVTVRFRDRAPAYYVARGGVEAAVGAIAAHAGDPTHAAGQEWWSSEEKYSEVPLGPGKYTLAAPEDDKKRPRFGLEDEESKINVNCATQKVLGAVPGLDEGLAREIVALRKRLNADEGRRDPEDAEKTADAVPADKPPDDRKKMPRPVDRPFRDLAGLLAVSGVTPEKLYGAPDKPGLVAFLTARSNGTVNVNSAPPEALVALGVPKERADRIARDRAPGAPGFRDFAAFASAAGLSPEAGKKLKKTVAFRSGNFRVTSVGKVPKAPTTVIQAQVSVYDDSVHVLGWKVTEGPPPEAQVAAEPAGGAGR